MCGPFVWAADAARPAIVRNWTPGSIGAAMTDTEDEEIEVEVEDEGGETAEMWLSEGDAYFPDAVGFFKAHPEVVFADRDVEGGVLFGVVGKGVVAANEYLKSLGAPAPKLTRVK
jgi:hypothetical protein